MMYYRHAITLNTLTIEPYFTTNNNCTKSRNRDWHAYYTMTDSSNLPDISYSQPLHYCLLTLLILSLCVTTPWRYLFSVLALLSESSGSSPPSWSSMTFCCDTYTGNPSSVISVLISKPSEVRGALSLSANCRAHQLAVLAFLHRMDNSPILAARANTSVK